MPPLINPECTVAKLYGEPLRHIPADLYIPPKALSVLLTAFEGPLDLLLYLIRQSNIDILDIPMAELTEQYLKYIEGIEENFELASDYLSMAAYLISIKSRLLLPRPPSNNAEEMEEDPRAELVRHLVEYEAFRQAAEKLDSRPRQGRDFFIAQIEWEKSDPRFFFTFADFQQAWQRVLKRQKINAAHQVAQEVWSIREQMSKILRLFEHHPKLTFTQLLTLPDVLSVVVHFVAILELARENLLILEQQAPSEPIFLSRAKT